MARANKIANRKVIANAMNQVDAWKSNGVPVYVTAYEAHKLTNGIVGDPYGVNHSYRPMHIVKVAVEMFKANA
jgi:hypothetical protein